MILRSIAVLMMGAAATSATVALHEGLSDASSPRVASIARNAVPADAANDLRAAESEPARTDEHLRNAVARDAWDTSTWIRLSADAETSGNLAQAQQYIEQALAHDAGSKPIWAAANFYFRREDQSSFLLWVNRYRDVTHQDEVSLFRMVAEVAPDTPSLLKAMPDLQCDELGTLLDTITAHAMDPDAAVERMTSTCHDAASRQALAHLVTGLLAQDKLPAAQKVRLRMGDSSDLDNAAFLAPITGEGFDWRINRSDDIQVRQPEGRGVEFEFHDRVQSGTVLLFQPLILEPNKLYRLAANLESDPADPEAFRWELVEVASGRHLPSGLDEENINRLPMWQFQAPVTSHTVALAMFYRRPDGALPFQGTVNLRGVQLAKALDPLSSNLAGNHRR